MDTVKTSVTARPRVREGADGAAAPQTASLPRMSRDGVPQVRRDDRMTQWWLLLLGSALLVGGGYALAKDFTADAVDAGWHVLLADIAVVVVGLPLFGYALASVLLGRRRLSR